MVLGSLTGVSFCLKVKSKTDHLLISQIWVDLLGRIAIRNKTSQKQEPLGEKLEISINKSKLSMNVLKVHFLYLKGRNVDSPSLPPTPTTLLFFWKSKTTKLFALKFCDRYWPSLRSRYFWVSNRRVCWNKWGGEEGLGVGKLLKN